MDGIPRISRAQRMDALSSMSTVTGYVIIAANLMSKFVPMIGTIKPDRFLVLGAGVVGLQAIATAKRLGGIVKAMNKDLFKIFVGIHQKFNTAIEQKVPESPKSKDPETAAVSKNPNEKNEILKAVTAMRNSKRIVIIPGYGMAWPRPVQSR